MTQIIVVTSGKGGVGKTTTSASLACGLARHGKKTVVIDFDVGLRNWTDHGLRAARGVRLRQCRQRRVHAEAGADQDKRFDNLFVLAASADPRQGRWTRTASARC